MPNLLFYQGESVLLDDFKSNYLQKSTLYALVAFHPEVQLRLFSSIESVSFINSPFEKAVKIPNYIKNIGENIKGIVKEINSLNYLTGGVDLFSYLDKIVVVTFCELKKFDNLIVETSGLDFISIMKLTIFCKKIVENFSHKTIVLVDNSLKLKNNSYSYLFRLNEEEVNFIEVHGIKNFFNNMITRANANI